MKLKSRKSALILSCLSLMLCFAMLIGSTFAWFTDTATTAVNTIQSGTLDVQLQVQDESGNWVDAKGETLEWQKAADGAGQEILWEPGASYNLDTFRIVNNGNLKLKYKVVISGATGDTDLLKAIDFKATIAKEDGTTENFDGVNVTDNTPVVVNRALDPKAYDEVTLNGTMQTGAGNAYQALTVNDIAITVYATQVEGEYDSTSNDYDKDATYPETVADIKAEYGVDGLNMPKGVVITDNGTGDDTNHFTITLKDKEAFVYFTQVFDRAAAFEARQAQWKTEGFTKYSSEYNQADLNMWYGPYCSRITVRMDCDVDLEGMSIKTFDMDGYVFTFDGNGHTIKNAKITSSEQNVGFFVRAAVKNLTLENITVTATGNTTDQSAGVVYGGYNDTISNVTVKNCSVTGGKYTGAIVGHFEEGHSITGCTVENTVVSGQYKLGGIVGYVSEHRSGEAIEVTGNTLTNVTVKGENQWPGKTEFVIGKIVGDWNAVSGTCKDNTFSGTTDVTDDIGRIENNYTVTQE